MTVPRQFRILLVLTLITGVGYLVVSHLTGLLHEYQQAREFSPVWGYVYLGMLTLAFSAALTLAIWTIWLLASASSEKRARRQAHGRAASQMSRAEQTAETELHVKDVEQLVDDPSLPAPLRESLGKSLTELRASALANNWRSWPLAQSPAASHRC